MAITIISKTDLARRTRQVVDQARHGQPIIVESYGEEQVAILDATDYRCLRALAAYHAQPSHTGPAHDRSLVPAGLDAADVEKSVAQSSGDPQAAWNLVLAAYFDGQISLGRAAELLNGSRFDLQQRFNRLGLPLRTGPTDLDEARREVAALR